MWYTALYMAKHNAMIAHIKKAAVLKYQILSENQVLGSQRLRPDLVLKKGNTILIIDVTIPFNNRIAAFKAAAEEKITKYETLRAELSTIHSAVVTVQPFIIGSLGSWDPANEPLLRLLCSRSYTSLMRKLCVSEIIGYSRDIYIENLTGT